MASQHSPAARRGPIATRSKPSAYLGVDWMMVFSHRVAVNWVAAPAVDGKAPPLQLVSSGNGGDLLLWDVPEAGEEVRALTLHPPQQHSGT